MLKRKISSLVLVVAIASSMVTSNVYASEQPRQYENVAQSESYSVRWISVAYLNTGISSSGNSLTSRVTCNAKNSSSKISGTLYLERYSNGRWVTATSWSVSRNGSIDVAKSYRGSSKTTYRTRFSGKVVSAGKSESINSTSNNISL